MTYVDDWQYEPLPLRTIPAHGHQWIDPSEPPIERATYSTVIGPRRREMKPGQTYQCRECGQVLAIPVNSEARR